MTQAQLIKVQESEARKLAARFEAAKEIRAALDKARKAIGPSYDEDEVEAAILELVTSEADQ